MKIQINDTVRDMTEEEIAAQEKDAIESLPIVKRMQRDALLAASDHMALADRITDEWRVYRQALRDLPEQSGFPDVNMPVAPS